ncbi:transposase-like protein [Paraburkholderia unamae]|uniref:Transposase-like protein n=1 Tax=Paraburkholderia unamae TaxID=219649 RepID=A0ABX5KRY2_9BURK|nr:transposase-like protein [Paraburkholderia unamae]
MSLARTTILRWVRRYAPEFVKRRNHFGILVGRSWRVDETNLTIRGKWVYLYRAVERAGQAVDFLLCVKRDVKGNKACFSKAIKHQGQPPKIVKLDGYAALHRVAREMKADGLLLEGTATRSSKHVHNLIERAHRDIKSRTKTMLGSKRFRNAAITLAGIELMHRIRKGKLALPACDSKMGRPPLPGPPSFPLNKVSRLRSDWLFAREPDLLPG